MSQGGAVFNIVLGLLAIGYSLIPPDRIRHYKRSIALLLRYAGLVLVLLSAISLWLRR